MNKIIWWMFFALTVKTPTAFSEEGIEFKDFKSGYFVVVNVATETLRLYDRQCSEMTCTNKMIMETEVVVGEDERPGKKSIKDKSLLGSYRITGWRKFYEDSLGHYPAWYSEQYPDVPKPSIHNPFQWLDKRYMPTNSQGNRVGQMRGAFGWYTAFVGPDAGSQWLHGTIGWGEDKDFYIQSVKKAMPNIFLDPRSAGCTRNNNEAISYLRSILPVGAPVIKIYAQEFLKEGEPSLNKFIEWNYILTKTPGKKADRDSVLNELGVTPEELSVYWHAKRNGDVIILDPNNPLNQVIEVGTYTLDTHPDVIKYTPGEKLGRFGRKLGRNGNVYGILSKDMRGAFFIDTGTLRNYSHPANLKSGGFSDEATPPWMQD